MKSCLSLNIGLQIAKVLLRPNKETFCYYMQSFGCDLIIFDSFFAMKSWIEHVWLF